MMQPEIPRLLLRGLILNLFLSKSPELCNSPIALSNFLNTGSLAFSITEIVELGSSDPASAEAGSSLNHWGVKQKNSLNTVT